MFDTSGQNFDSVLHDGGAIYKTADSSVLIKFSHYIPRFFSLSLFYLRKKVLFVNVQLITSIKIQIIFKNLTQSFLWIIMLIFTRPSISTSIREVFPATNLQIFAVSILSEGFCLPRCWNLLLRGLTYADLKSPQHSSCDQN